MGFNYSEIFNKYQTAEGKDFLLISRSINLPDNHDLDIFDSRFMQADTAWTIASYMVYGTIDYWWLLCLANKAYKFYAPEGEKMWFVKPEYLPTILAAINQEI